MTRKVQACNSRGSMGKLKQIIIYISKIIYYIILIVLFIICADYLGMFNTIENISHIAMETTYDNTEENKECTKHIRTNINANKEDITKKTSDK